MILDKHFREKVNQAMAAQGWSQSDLSREMGKSRQYVYQYLQGLRSPGFDVVEHFARALHVEPWNLLDDSPLKVLVTNE